jgi:hypothetical protein
MNRRAFLPIAINSTAFFLIAYILIFCLTKFTTALSASVFDIPTIIHTSQIDFIVRGSDWTSDSVKVVFSTAPLVSLLVSMLLWILYTQVIEESGMLRLLLAWMILHGIIFFLGEILIGALFSQGFGYVIMYMFFMDTGKMILTLTALIGMVTAGILISKQLLFTANIYFNDLPAKQAPAFVLYQFIIPFFAGNMILFLVKLPDVLIYDISVNMTMLFILFPFFLRSGMIQEFYFDEDPRKIRMSKTIILSAAAILLLFRIVFGFGVRL